MKKLIKKNELKDIMVVSAYATESGKTNGAGKGCGSKSNGTNGGSTCGGKTNNTDKGC